MAKAFLSLMSLVFFMLYAQSDLKDYSCYLFQMKIQSIVVKEKPEEKANFNFINRTKHRRVADYKWRAAPKIYDR